MRLAKQDRDATLRQGFTSCKRNKPPVRRRQQSDAAKKQNENGNGGRLRRHRLARRMMPKRDVEQKQKLGGTSRSAVKRKKLGSRLSSDKKPQHKKSKSLQ